MNISTGTPTSLSTAGTLMVIIHVWVGIIITRNIGLLVTIFPSSLERSPSRPGGLMTSAALPSSWWTARKAYWMRTIFPWKIKEKYHSHKLDQQDSVLYWIQINGHRLTCLQYIFKIWSISLRWMGSILLMVVKSINTDPSVCLSSAPNMSYAPSNNLRKWKIPHYNTVWINATPVGYDPDMLGQEQMYPRCCRIFSQIPLI